METTGNTVIEEIINTVPEQQVVILDPPGGGPASDVEAEVAEELETDETEDAISTGIDMLDMLVNGTDCDAAAIVVVCMKIMLLNPKLGEQILAHFEEELRDLRQGKHVFGHMIEDSNCAEHEALVWLTLEAGLKVLDSHT